LIEKEVSLSDSSPIGSFGNIAKDLARNPLGIIALFIVLVYGFAALVTGATTFAPGEREPLIWFLVFFPVAVLLVFSWLVSQHSDKLFAPSDFKRDEDFLRWKETASLNSASQIRAAVALTAASAKAPDGVAQFQIDEIVETIQSTAETSSTKNNAKTQSDEWTNHILWVDDNPQNNEYERRAFEAVGMRFTLSENTAGALKILRETKFAAIISDMGRREGPREGYALLDAVRNMGLQTPLYFYAASRAPEHIAETIAHGGQGCTNNAQELFALVTKAVVSGKAR